MSDAGKLNLCAALATLLMGLTLLYNVFGETLVRETLGRIERQAYYQNVIAPRGLSLREAEFWEPADRESPDR